jgi:DNA-directed RNA polymerase specialized sigma24 family protein
LIGADTTAEKNVRAADTVRISEKRRGNLNAAVRSQEEIAEAIRSLTLAQLARLRKTAEVFSYAMEPDDLLQEALARAISGDRHCPAHLDLVTFLGGVMRSIASGEHERAKLRPPLVALAHHGGEPGKAPDPHDTSLDVSETLERDQETRDLLKRVVELFADDAEARDIIEGRLAEMTAEELKELTAWTTLDTQQN